MSRVDGKELWFDERFTHGSLFGIINKKTMAESIEQLNILTRSGNRKLDERTKVETGTNTGILSHLKEWLSGTDLVQSDGHWTPLYAAQYDDQGRNLGVTGARDVTGMTVIEMEGQNTGATRYQPQYDATGKKTGEVMHEKGDISREHLRKNIWNN